MAGNSSSVSGCGDGVVVRGFGSGAAKGYIRFRLTRIRDGLERTCEVGKWGSRTSYTVGMCGERVRFYSQGGKRGGIRERGCHQTESKRESRKNVERERKRVASGENFRAAQQGAIDVSYIFSSWSRTCRFNIICLGVYISIYMYICI